MRAKDRHKMVSYFFAVPKLMLEGVICFCFMNYKSISWCGHASVINQVCIRPLPFISIWPRDNAFCAKSGPNACINCAVQ